MIDFAEAPLCPLQIEGRKEENCNLVDQGPGLSEDLKFNDGANPELLMAYIRVTVMTIEI